MREMRSRIILILSMILTSFWGFANENEGNGVIRGEVTTSDGKPGAYVSIKIKGSNKSTVADEDGHFILRGFTAGSYELEISLTGYETLVEKVTLIENETKVIQFQLQITEKQLEEVIVRSGLNKFAIKESAYVARMPLNNLENPQTYSVIGKKLIEEQVITNFNDVLKNAPGIDKLWTATGRGGDGAAYFSLRGFAVQPSMINGIAGQTNGGLDPANIESVEVIKGPSGTLFGSSLISFGGLVNIVTKKPMETTRGEISYTNGTYGLNRLTLDYNTALNKEKSVLFRVNGAYHYENSFQDAGFRKSFFVAPSLVYKASDKLDFHLNAEFFNSEATNPVMVFLNRSRQLIYRTPDELGIDYKKSFTSNDITVKNPTLNVFGQMNYKLSSAWTSQTNFSQSVRKSDGLYSYIMFLQPDNDTLLSRLISSLNSVSTTTNFQQNFIGDFSIGKVRNRTVIGLDATSQKTMNNNTAYILFDYVNSVEADPRYAQLTRPAVEARLGANNAPTKNNSEVRTYSAYISNVTNITKQLLLMTSLRVDRFDNRGTRSSISGGKSGDFKQTALSPKLGLVYAVVPDRISVFANYMNGFRNVAPVSQPDGSISVFDPQQANQWEAGVKLDAFDGRVSGSLSYYDIAVTNVVIPDPNRTGFSIQEGDVVSRGFEADIKANPVRGLNVVAGYSYNFSENTNAAPATDGLRPTNAGPKHLANAWISYQLPIEKLKGLGVGFGGNYASENLITNSAPTGKFVVPAYTILNATVFYNSKGYRLALKVDNLSNERYWKGWTTLEPQMPRRVSASIAVRF